MSTHASQLSEIPYSYHISYKKGFQRVLEKHHSIVNYFDTVRKNLFLKTITKNLFIFKVK